MSSEEVAPGPGAEVWDEELFDRPTQVSVHDFVEYYDLYKPLLPFDDRSGDPIITLAGIAARLNRMPITAESVPTYQLFEHVPTEVASAYHMGPGMARALGAWVYETNGGWRYVNPNYVHHRSLGAKLTERDEWFRVARQYAAVGTLGLTPLADRFGTDVTTVEEWIDAEDVPWQRWRDEGQRRLMRSIHTAAYWHDEYTAAQIAEVLDIDDERFDEWDAAHTRSFTPPADPSYQWWFACRESDHPTEERLERMIDFHGVEPFLTTEGGR